MNVRPSVRGDLDDLSAVLDDTGLFPREFLPDLIEPFLSRQADQDIWLTCETGGQATGFCYAVPERLTDGTWNMLAIAVLPARQGQGVGSTLVAHLEATLRACSQRVLIAETSGTAPFAATRRFYRRNGYVEEARIRNFWADGDDKIVFWKVL